MNEAQQQVIGIGLQNIGAQVLSDEDLKRIGAGYAGMNTASAGGDGVSAATPTTPAVFDWQAENTYSLALQAFIYGFPYVYGAQTRFRWVTQPRDPEHVPYSAINHFWHAPGVIDASYQDGGCPNNDTMYSVAWLDLSTEPIILSVPDLDDRYYCFQLSAMHSDNFAYVGRRTTGTKAGHFAIVGPGWSGDLPAGVAALEPSPTPWVLCLGRTLVDGADDVPNVRAIQQQYALTPLGQWGTTGTTTPERRDVLEPIEMSKDPLGPWKTLNAVLAENPPPAEHAVLLKQFGTIGIGAGLDPEQEPETVKKNLLRAAGAGMQLLKQHFLSGYWATIVNGWRYPPLSEGRAGDDFLLRAACQSLAGIVANDPDEAVYLVNFDDADGHKLAADGSYELHFTGDSLPPVDAFWSLTVSPS